MENLRAFQHCKKNIDLVCFQLPDICPLCGQSTATTESRIPPYVLPSPLKSSHAAPRSIVLKPTNGDFICNYDKTCNLHIGITDKEGQVFDFDEYGLKTSSMWNCCITIEDLCWPIEWDNALKDVCNLPLWSSNRYKEGTWNCFDFVLNFLHLIKSISDSRQKAMTREEFCDNFLVKKTKAAEHYIHLYRQALLNGYVIVHKNMT